jgi:CRP-like cAMP-binding protein
MYSSNDPYRANPVGRDARLAGYAPVSRSKPPRLTRGDRKDLLAQLSGYPLLAGCEQRDLVALIKAGHLCSLPAGWAMMAESTPPDFCYVILKGSAAVYRHGDRIADLGPGALVGEMAVLSGDLRSATVTTTTRVSALGIDKSTLDAMLFKRPSLDRAVRRQVVERTEAPTQPPRPRPAASSR